MVRCGSLATPHESFDVIEDVLLAGGVQRAVASAHIVVCARGAEELVCSPPGDVLRTAVHFNAVDQEFAGFAHPQASSGYGMTPVRSASTNISPSMTGL